MNKNKDKKNKIRAKISAIRKIVESDNLSIEQLSDMAIKDLPSEKGFIQRKTSDYSNKLKAKRTDNKNIFEELIETVDTFLGSDKTDEKTGKNKTDNINTGQKPQIKNKLRKYSTDSAKTALRNGKQHIINAVQSNFYIGENACGTQNTMPEPSITLSPKEFDFFNLLTIDPDTSTGSVLYEDEKISGYIKMNREFFNKFDSGGIYNFVTLSGNTLFRLAWNSGTQKYSISGLKGQYNTTKISEFLLDYYSSIEQPDIQNVIKQAMYLTLNGIDGEPLTITTGINIFNRLLQKILSACGQLNNDKTLNQTPINQYIEDDIEWYFDFNDMEGIDIDDEDARIRKVLKFRDCDNFEIQLEPTYMEDFIYFAPTKIMDDNVVNTINRTARDAFEESSQTISLENLQNYLYSQYIVNLPKALIMSFLSPKMFFPIAVIYKSSLQIETSAQNMMKNLNKLFFDLIKKLFWDFIQNFWGYVKKDLQNFLEALVAQILKNKLKRYKIMLTSLINLLTKLLNANLDNCEAIYNIILNTIDTALSVPAKLPIPGALLGASDKLPGYSTDRAYLNITERLAANGIPTEDLYGVENDLNTIIQCIINGNTQELDENSYIEVALKPAIANATPQGQAIAIMMSSVLKGTGKLF